MRNLRCPEDSPTIYEVDVSRCWCTGQDDDVCIVLNIYKNAYFMDQGIRSLSRHGTSSMYLPTIFKTVLSLVLQGFFFFF